MIVAAIVCAATMSQAATITWGGAIADPAYDGTYTNNQAYPATAMLLWSSEAFTGVAKEISGIAVGSTADNGGSVVKTFNITAQEAVNTWTFSDDYVTTVTADGYYAVLITNGDGTKASYYDIGNVTGTTASSSPVNKTVNATWGGGEWLEQGGYTVTVGAVPEPTSGLLLLLGVGGLALRRRRA